LALGRRGRNILTHGQTKGCKRMRQRGVGEFRGAVLIADDHQVFRIGLAQLLRRHLKVTRLLEAGSFAEAMEHLQNKDVTLAIVDLRMPGLVGPQGITQMRFLRPEAQIVVLSASDCREDILGALAAGVHGYIVKSQHTDQLIDRLRYILSGEIYVPPILAERLPDKAAKLDASRVPMQNLSARQRQVLMGLVEGKSNKEIAQALNVAEGTVKMHLAALFRVLGATNRAHAVAMGKQLID
jgi:DNA-binding NarL/FixJ family response regulator